MKIEIELPEIKGYEYTGEYRTPVKGDWYLDNRIVFECTGAFTRLPVLILKQKAPKYKSTTVDTGRELFNYVEIQALKDAFVIIDEMNFDPAIEAGDCTNYDELRELIK